MSADIYLAFGCGLFLGGLLGILFAGCCIMARGDDDVPPPAGEGRA